MDFKGGSIPGALICLALREPVRKGYEERPCYADRICQGGGDEYAQKSMRT